MSVSKPFTDALPTFRTSGLRLIVWCPRGFRSEGLTTVLYLQESRSYLPGARNVARIVPCDPRAPKRSSHIQVLVPAFNPSPKATRDHIDRLLLNRTVSMTATPCTRRSLPYNSKLDFGAPRQNQQVSDRTHQAL